MNSGTILNILIGILAVSFLSLAIFLGIFLYRRWKSKTVRFNIIGVDGQIKRKRIKTPNPKKNKLFGKVYFYNQKAELKDFWGINMFYFDGISDPIIFDRQDKVVKLSASNIAKVMEDNFISRLFSPSNVVNIASVFGFLTLIAVLGVLYFTVIDPTNVTLVNSPDNLAVLSQACKIALSGGV